MGNLFGTDGVRGIANDALGCETALQLGRAAAAVLTQSCTHRAKVLIGKDTRASSDMLEHALAAGLCSVGADVELLGVLPTPAVAYCTAREGADAGVMISASHNPAQYNGIKLFSASGQKLPDETEAAIEANMAIGEFSLAAPTAVGRVAVRDDADDAYIRHLCGAVESNDLPPLRIAVDCANGSACRTAKKLFTALGVDAYYLHDAPDGSNINRHCGSTDTDALRRFVLEHHCDAGVAFDGDADRCLAVDEQGERLDGDRILALLACDLQTRGKLTNGIVVTVMRNLGLLRFCESRGIPVEAVRVGDRYVLEQMQQSGCNLGGEQSGHIILSDHMPTGDGQLTAVSLLAALGRAMQNGVLSLHAWAKQMPLYPQVLKNVVITPTQKAFLLDSRTFPVYLRGLERSLGDSGRILVRPSGTEALIRILAEGTDAAKLEQITEQIAQYIRAI